MSALSITTDVSITGGVVVSTGGGGFKPDVSRDKYFSFLQPLIAMAAMKMEKTIIVLINFIFLLVLG
ncbi:hypothetical protein GCM10022210_38470 [Mucilaginibacter dorajii]|uniref:Uncharacterized protein n=1 Tax=Mucilaginibacter dorajii TaxID=692994 RepID=A0ABP7QIM1_9SPHI